MMVFTIVFCIRYICKGKVEDHTGKVVGRRDKLSTTLETDRADGGRGYSHIGHGRQVQQS